MKERNEIKIGFKVSKWLFIAVALLSFASIIYVLIVGEVSVANYIMKSVEVIISSLFLAFIMKAFDKASN